MTFPLLSLTCIKVFVYLLCLVNHKKIATVLDIVLCPIDFSWLHLQQGKHTTKPILFVPLRRPAGFYDLPFSLTVHVPWAVMNVALVACRKASAPACAHQTSDMSSTHIKSSEQQPTVNVTLDGLFIDRKTRSLHRNADYRFSSALATQCHQSGWKIGNVHVLTLHV